MWDGWSSVFLAYQLCLAHTLVRKWLRLGTSFKKIPEAIKPGPCLSFTLWFSKSMLFSCQWLYVECGLAFWPIFMLQSIFSVNDADSHQEFWRLQLCTLCCCSSLLSLPKWFSSFFPTKLPRCSCLVLVLVFFCVFFFFIFYLNSVIPYIIRPMQLLFVSNRIAILFVTSIITIEPYIRELVYYRWEACLIICMWSEYFPQ